LEKNPLNRPTQYSVPDFLDPTKRLTEEENYLLHEIMKKLGVLMLKYRVIPKSYFKDAVNIIIYMFLFIKFPLIINFFFFILNFIVHFFF